MKQSLLIRHLRPLLMTVLAVVAGAVPCTSLADTANDTGLSTTTGNETDVKKPTATFSADGSTLVITASGDLTNYSSTVQTLTKRKFSSAAATKITTAENTSSFVKAGDEYQSYNTYYEATVTYKEVASNDISTYLLLNSWDGKYTVQWNQPQTYKSADEGTEGSMTISVGTNDVTVIPLSPGASITFDTSKDKLYVAENATYKKITDKDAFLANTEYFDNEYTSSEKTFSEQVKAKLDEGSYSSVRFVKAEGGADITISLDQMEAIIAYNNYNSKSNLQSNNSLIDFSAVGTISGLGAKEVPNTVNNVSVVLPDALSDDVAKSIASEQKNGNWYWLSDDGTILNVEGLNPGKFSSAASVKLSGETKSIVVRGKVGFDILEQKNLQNLDIAGIDNLDIHYVTTTDGNQFSMNEPFTVFNGFKNLKRVVIPGTDDISTLKEPDDYESSVEVFQSLPVVVDHNTWQPTKDHILQTRVMKENVINNLSHYTPEDFKNAVEFAFIGKLSYGDFSFFSGIEGKKVNLIHVSLKDASKTTFEALETIKNNNIEYLALPDAGCDTTSTLFPKLNENMPNLKGLGYFNDTTFTAQTWKEPGGICILTAMMQPVLIPSSGTSKVKSVRISGPVNAEDLGREMATVDKDGHLTYKITTKCVQEDKVDSLTQKYIAVSTDSADHYDRSHGAFSYANFTTADLSGAEIDEKHPNDLCLSLLGCYQNCTSIELPRTGKEIPVGCFANFGSLTSICIPESYDSIRSGAFENVNSLRNISTTITTTNGDSIVSLGDSTMVISKNMKLIETGAFGNVEKIVDVYCLGDEAPEAQRWAFNTTMTYGNSGFSPSPAITRKNYNNGGKPITVLHFPTTCNAEQIEKYTDPTREYSITDGQGTTDGHGHYLVWPNQSEFIRAYVQGHTGYTWKAWNDEREPYNNGLVYALNEGMQAHQTQADSLWNKNNSPAGTKFYDSKKTSAPKDYRGWHEFALVAAYNYEEPDPIYDFGAVRDNNWWTLCLPFDMTKKNLRLVFGNPKGSSDDIKNKDNYPRVCELTGVERNLSTHSIVLQFGKDLVMNTSETNATVPDEDAVIMKAGHPYLIKPKMPDAESEDTWTPSNHILKYSQIGKKFSDLLAEYGEDGVGGILRDSIKDVHAVKATQAEGSEKENDTYFYRFIATFASWYIPRYSYFLGWYVDRPAWWWKPSTTATERHWAPNTCIILVKKNSDEAPEFVTSAGKQEVAHWNVTSSGFEFCQDDTFADLKPSGSKRAGMVFGISDDSGTATGVSHVTIDTSKADVMDAAPIYNLNGQMVSRSGDTSSLGSGVYIRNGKKFVIK